jgi:hypothetical protein
MTNFRKGDWVVVCNPDYEIRHYQGYVGTIIHSMKSVYHIRTVNNFYGDFLVHEIALAPPLILAMNGIRLNED